LQGSALHRQTGRACHDNFDLGRAKVEQQIHFFTKRHWNEISKKIINLYGQKFWLREKK